MSRFRTLQKTVSKSKHYLIDLQYIKCIFAQYLSKFSETYFEHPTCKGKSLIFIRYKMLLPLQVGCSKSASKARPLFGGLFIAIAVRRYSKTHI